MRFAVLMDRFREGHGGAEAWLARFAAAARDGGDGALLVTADARDPRGGTAFDGWVRVPTGAGPRFLRDRAFARRADGAARAAGAERTLGIRHVLSCDVYQPHGGVHGAALEGTATALANPAARAARRAARALSPKQRSLLAIERALLRDGGARRVVALSPRVLADLRERFPDAARRAVVIPPGVDLERFRPAPAAGPPGPAAGTLLFLAREPRLKGLAPLLEALPLLRRAGERARLVAAGAFPAAPWRRLAARLGVADAVEFPGHHGRPEDLYARAGALAHPTFYDPCSLVALEALACGLPVVTTRANGASAWMEPGAGTVIEDPRDAAALADALGRALAASRDPEARSAARRSAEAAGGAARIVEVLELLRATA